MIEEVLINCCENISEEEKNRILNIDFSKSIREVPTPVNSSDLEDILLDEKTTDNGGIIAMTGFYYQMMVSVLYLGEVFQSKWDGMFLDHHQDIVLFNDSQKIVKFVQVKTKNKTSSSADNVIVEKWIPKLFGTAYNIEKLKDFEIRFEIVSNCFFQDQKNYNISPFYLGADSRGDRKIKELVTKAFNNQMADKDDTKKRRFLELAFQNFNMKHITSQSLESQVVSNIPKILGFGTSQLTEEILNNIIAEFFKACYNPDDASIQVINEERQAMFKEYIKKKLTDDLATEYHRKTDESILTKYFTKLDDVYTNQKLNQHFVNEFRKFVKFFKEDIEEALSSSSLTMTSIINMYIKNDRDLKVNLEETECDGHFNDILSLLLFLKVYIDDKLKIKDKSRHILSIELNKLLFLILGNNDDLKESSEIIQSFKDLYPRLDNSEKLRIASCGDISIIISGIFDNENRSEYTKLKKEELDFSQSPSINNPKLDDMITNNIMDVQIPINILYMHRDNINNINKTRKKYKNLADMKNKINEELKLDGIIQKCDDSNK